MARTQAFDRDTVVRAARTVFWEHGYDGASIPELEEATGIRRSSLYNTFGSKRGLFDEAVQSYLDEVIRPRLRPFKADPVVPDALTDYLTGLWDAFGNLDSMPATNGCLLVNTARESIAHDSAVAQLVAEYRAELASAMRRGVHAQRPASLATQTDDLAENIVALVIAAFALARVDSTQARHNLTLALRLAHD